MDVLVIGSGFSGMVASCYLQKAGYQVTVLEKNSSPGGRARSFSAQGFHFDMGPSWYWMPEVFENFFKDFGYASQSFYDLKRLQPSYSVFFDEEKFEIPASVKGLADLFESIEPGSAEQLNLYLKDAEVKYELGMNDFAQKPALSITEYLSKDIFGVLKKLQPFRNMEDHVKRYFKNPYLQKIMQFPVIFLGAMPDRIPAMYSLMNYADTALGTWYPMGGMYKIVEAIYSIAKELGVKFHFNQNVESILIENGNCKKVITKHSHFNADIVIGSGDYHYIEQTLPKFYQQYKESYWDKKEMAPSSLLFFVGVNKKLPIQHHSLFFDTGFDAHAATLYNNPSWPENPLFYVCAPSVTDPSVAPPDHENLFFLIPVAAGLGGDTNVLREQYFENIVSRLEARIGTNIKDHIVYKRSYGSTDFTNDYHAYRGNAYGMANTLLQTAFGKPRMKSKKVNNLYYCGQLTVPGPGVPPAFLSGKMVAQQVSLNFKLPSKTFS